MTKPCCSRGCGGRNLVDERTEAVAALRRVCRSFGDDNWPSSLHLADIIEKHLERHLEANIELFRTGPGNE